MGIVNYSQKDPRWADIDYSAPGEKTTIAKAGCGPTSMAMAAASFVDPAITPTEVAAWSLAHKFKAKNAGTYYGFFAAYGKSIGLDISQVNGSNIYGRTSTYAQECHQRVLDAIKAGDLVIACMGKGLWTSSGHFILLYNVVGSVAYINDPNSTATNRIQGDLGLFQSQVKYYFIVKKPDAKAVTVTHTANYYAVQKKYGFTDVTMEYLEAYQYADSLFAVMLQSLNARKLQVNTIAYLLAYPYGHDIINKLNS